MSQKNINPKASAESCKAAELEESYIEETIFLQFVGWEVCINDVRDRIVSEYDEIKGDDDPIRDLALYLKPEEAKAYYVINDDYAGSVDLFAW